VRYKAVVNQEEQYSIWPADRENPCGWENTGKSGNKQECLEYIKNVWIDMRPKSLRNQMLETSGAAHSIQRAHPTCECIHHLFEAHVERTPDALAVIFEDEQLTYGELNQRANQLAHYLQKLGLGREEKVGLCVDRCVDMVVGMLGILKAGGVYQPLDPAYPDTRLSLLIRETQMQMLLTHERFLEKFPEHATHLVCLDKDSPLIYNQTAANLNNVNSAASLAYVIHTSGSTGMPKGVMVMHVSLRHYAQDLQEQIGIASDDVFLHTASIAFSSSVRQLLVPLAHGAAIAIATTEQKTNPLALFELIKRRGVTIVDTVPTFWRSCIEALEGLEPRAKNDLLDNKLRLIQTTGEPLSLQIVNKWRFDFKHSACLMNMYGATETSGSVAVYHMMDEENEQGKTVPLGKPIANAQTYLLGPDLQPVPEGTSGELYVGGPRLALGYLNRPDLTAETFIPDSFNNRPGARLWKSGDLACCLSDGNIGFIGRKDYQINIRGIRIEPGEIESVLSDHPAIRQAVVVDRENNHGEKFLAAYVTCSMKTTPTVSNLRGFLHGKIPDSMIPSTFVFLNTMPLTTSGKIDRKALPAPPKTRPHLENPFIEARTPVEETLVQIWSKVLGIDQVGIHDNFFELGGNSLMGTRVVSHIRDTFFLDLPVRLVFENPTVAELAVTVTQRKAAKEERKDIEHILAQLETLSDEEAQELLYEKNRTVQRRSS